MEAYIASDLHWDDWAQACRTAENYINGWEIPASISYWKKETSMPGLLRKSDVIIVAGDIANTYKMWTEMVTALSKNYKEVVIVPGNHDLTVDWGDQEIFKTSEEKLNAYKEFCKYYPNVHFLDGEVIKIGNTTIGGCMGMWDTTFVKQGILKQFFNEDAAIERWAKKNWKHWFDCRHWKYLDNDIDKIAEVEFAKLNKCLEQKPDIMVTHFCPYPGEDHIPYEYRKSECSTFFYFNPDYTKQVKYWIAGHTHTPYSKICENKNTIVNPIGYFAERFDIESAKGDKWTVEL